MKTRFLFIKNNKIRCGILNCLSSARFAVLPICLAIIAGNATAQTAAEKMINGTNTQKTTRVPVVKPTKQKTKTQVKKPVTTNEQVGGQNIRKRDPKPDPRVDQLQKVIVTTAASDVEIWADGKKVGMSNKSGKALLILSSGQHQIFAKRGDNTLISPTLITVSPTQVLFDYSVDISKAIEAIHIADMKAMKDANTPVETPKQIDAEAILESYRDPMKSESITVNDWQIVYRQASEQMTAGSSSNKVESLVAFARGQIQLAAGDSMQAVNAFSAATVFTPDSALAYYGLGLAQLASSNKDDAMNSFLKSIQLDGKFALPYKQLGDIYLSQGKGKEAATAYQQAKTQGLTSTALRQKIAETQIKNKNYAAAVKELEVLEKEAPSSDVYISLSDCYIEQKRSVSAIEALNKAIALEPNQPLAYQKVGTIYLKQKEFGKATESLERALALDVETNKLNHKELQGLIQKARKKDR